jgi:hypothetical protein
MPSFASFDLLDREDTPVSHTFTPNSLEAGLGTFVESDGVPVGDNKITVSVRRSGAKYKARLVMSAPTIVTETINGVDSSKVSRTAYADLTLTFDATSTRQERENLVGMFANALSADNTPIDGVITGLEGLY